MNNLIELHEINKVYNPGKNEIKALDNISLNILSGEFISIIGQSGSGKSTLMNILGCLDTPTSGEYLLNGEPVLSFNQSRLSSIRNKSIGFIFQGFNLISSLSALENVELPLIYRGIKREERRRLAIKALDRVGLSARMSHRPGEMSGGQQQRVAIARALAAYPSIILADEPTGNLDTISGREVMDILIGLHKEGKTVILITHDNLLANLAERTIRICDGRIQ